MMEISADNPILITGAAGFVGGYLLKAFADEGFAPASLIALSTGEAPVEGAGETIAADITDAARIGQIIADHAPAAVVHLAAIAQPGEAARNRGTAWNVNVGGTLNIAEAILSASPSTRLVFASSSEVYGASFNDAGGSVTESAPLQPMSAYGATKAAADIALGQMAHEGLDVVRFRAFNHTGPGQAPDYVVPAFAEQIARIEAGRQPPVLKVGNLEARRDFLDVRDVVRAYALAAAGKGASGAAYNLSSGTAHAIRSVLDTLLDSSDAEITIETDPDRLRPSDVPHAAGDNTAVRAALGWAPAIAFDQTLRDVLQGYRAAYA